MKIQDVFLELVLPCTVDAGPNAVVWVRVHSAILAANRRLYHEGVEIMYGRDSFATGVIWDYINFACESFYPLGWCPRRTIALPGKVAKRNVWHSRRLFVRIPYVGNNIGMIRYDFGGPGLKEHL